MDAIVQSGLGEIRKHLPAHGNWIPTQHHCKMDSANSGGAASRAGFAASTPRRTAPAPIHSSPTRPCSTLRGEIAALRTTAGRDLQENSIDAEHVVIGPALKSTVVAAGFRVCTRIQPRSISPCSNLRPVPDMKQTLGVRAGEHGHPFSPVVPVANHLRSTTCVIMAETAHLSRGPSRSGVRGLIRHDRSED